MTNDALPEYVRALLESAAYPHAPSEVRLVQTHISYVFLADGLVYKTKKPVDFGFINQMAAEARERFCHEEVRLNTRLAPDVYLGVAPVVRRADGSYIVDVPVEAGAVVVEWAVKMRRLPDDRTLDVVLDANRAPGRLAERLVQALIAFHEAAGVVGDESTGPTPGGRSYAGGPAETAWWAREYAEAAINIAPDGTWRAEDAAETKAFFDSTIEAEQALFDARLAAGRVVEGHGDLQAKHVYLLGAAMEQIAIVDCIEFTDWFHFRYLDVGYDVAFLAMDLEAQGHAALGDELAGRYIAGAHDETMGVLQPLHRAFRAFVRGKVESIGARATELPAAQRAELGASAARYFRLAAEYGRRGAAPSLVVLCGLQGTGKSTVGATLAGRIGAAYLSSDAIRKELAGLDPRARVEDADREGLYSGPMSGRTYAELRRRAGVHLAAGRPVVVDATHPRASERRETLGVAQAHGVPGLIVELRLDEAEAYARIDGRADDPLRISDATREVYDAARRRFQPVQPAEGPQLILDATREPAALAREIASMLPARDA